MVGYFMVLQIYLITLQTDLFHTKKVCFILPVRGGVL